jgi:prepilin-type N-terminal cleavage/methylation domain-containing protein/prepilin-type processing-associated H-X9-DG protein
MDKSSVKRGFTLIELLVVIAVIAMLLAIILPSLKRAREAGHRITCMSNLKSLAAMIQMYATENDNKVPSGSTEGSYAWVNHSGGLAYYNINGDPVLEEQQKEAIRRGPLWPYAGETIDMFRCPTARLGQARSYSIPDSFAYDNLWLLSVNGATGSLLIKNLGSIKNPGGRMLFIDEGWATPASWSIMYKASQWWDVVPERHASGTTLAFVDGHTDYWKWKDERTRTFAREAAQLDNPNDATYWRRTQPGNEDIQKLVTAVWGCPGWTGNGGTVDGR